MRPRLERWREFLTPPDDPALVVAGQKGELMVARVRLVAACFIVMVPVLSLLLEPERPENLSSSIAALVSLAWAVGVWWVVSQRRVPTYLPLTTTLVDVTVVSALQLTYLVQGLPSVAVNSRTTFLVYFVTISAACLRWDPRLCLTAGLLAMVQYVGIIIGASIMHASGVTPDLAGFGEIFVGQQLGRLVLLGVFTFVCVVIVHQSLRLRISATHDALTRLMNRAYFEERLEDELSRSARHESPFCIALLDIDHFKQVNDEHGHDAGDAALRVVATVLRRSLRRTDLVARWGGEEFAVAFPETRVAEAFGKLEQLRVEMESHRVQLSTGGELRLTISGGLASMRHDGRTIQEIVAAADARLLEAKRSGRNQIRTAPPSDNPSGVWRAIVKVGTRTDPQDGEAL